MRSRSQKCCCPPPPDCCGACDDVRIDAGLLALQFTPTGVANGAIGMPGSCSPMTCADVDATTYPLGTVVCENHLPRQLVDEIAALYAITEATAHYTATGMWRCVAQATPSYGCDGFGSWRTYAWLLRADTGELVLAVELSSVDQAGAAWGYVELAASGPIACLAIGATVTLTPLAVNEFGSPSLPQPYCTLPTSIYVTAV